MRKTKMILLQVHLTVAFITNEVWDDSPTPRRERTIDHDHETRE